MSQTTLFAGPERLEVSTSSGQAQPPVGAAANGVHIMLVLPVVLPEAHRAYLVPAPLTEGEESAARTRIRLVPARPAHIEEHQSILAISAMPLEDRPRKTTETPYLELTISPSSATISTRPAIGRRPGPISMANWWSHHPGG